MPPSLFQASTRLCWRCWLEWTKFDDGIEVYWHVNPVKETCILCAGFDAEWSPLFVPMEDLDPGLVEAEADFIDS